MKKVTKQRSIMLGIDFYLGTGAKIIDAVFDSLKIDSAGLHGANHWRAVYLNGLEIEKRMPEAGIDLEFVRHFALLHDSQREREDADPEHGQRAADFAGKLQKDGLIKLPDMLSFKYALALHSLGLTSYAPSIPAILVCWDADRLDYGRIGHEVEPDMLCTDAAREILAERTKC